MDLIGALLTSCSPTSTAGFASLLKDDRREMSKVMSELERLAHECKHEREEAAARDKHLHACIGDMKKALEDMRKVRLVQGRR